MAQLTNAQLVNNLKPYFATRRELQETVLAGIGGGAISSIVGGTGIVIGGTPPIISVTHDTGDFGDLHTNYAEHDQQETISAIWNHTADLQINGANLSFIGSREINTDGGSSLSITPDANLTLDPGGDILFNPFGNDILPVNNYDLNLGALNKKYLTLHAAELWVETLVAQNTIATIGGRVLVGPTTVLEANFGLTTGSDLLTNGDFETLGAGDPDFFASWTEFENGDSVIADETTNVHGGGHAFKGTFVTTGSCYVYQDFSVTAGTNYVLDWWTRGDGSVGGNYRIYDVSNAADIVATTATGVTGSTYVNLSVEFTAPPGCSSIRIYLFSPASAGDAYHDDATVYKIPDTIDVKHNQISQGDMVYMEANGKVEFMLITSPYSGSGPYTYSVQRDLDGSGINEWFAGDAVFNTGIPTNGFIDLYSVSGVAAGSTAGPTIVGNVRPTTSTLILDGGLEIVAAGPDWESWTETPGSGALVDETTLVHSGSHAVKATYVTGEAYVNQQFSVTAGEMYFFSLWTRGDGSIAGQYQLRDVTNAADIVSKRSTGVSEATYRRIVFSFVAPAGCTTANIFLFSPPSAGDAYFDDVNCYLRNYNGWTEHWAIGNLNGLYGYGTDTYGSAFGRSDMEHITIDDTNGIRFFDAAGSTVLAQWDADVITLGDDAGGEYITLASTGIEMFSSSVKVIDIDSSGNAAFGNIATNEANVYWNNSNNRLEFRGGTSGTVIQSYIDTDGSFIAGNLTNKDVTINTSGITLSVGTAYDEGKAITWKSGTSRVLDMWGYRDAGANTAIGWITTQNIEETGAINITGDGSASGLVVLTAIADGSPAVSLTVESTFGGTTWIYTSSDFGVAGGLQVGGTSVNVATGYARILNGLYVGNLGVEASNDSIVADGFVFVGDTQNGNMGRGITINQATFGDEILSLKSIGSVAHGMTTITETDTYGYFQKYNSGDGGLSIHGLADNGGVGLVVRGIAPTTITDRNTSAVGCIMAVAYQNSGTGIANPGSDANIFVWKAGTNTRLIVDQEGEVHSDAAAAYNSAVWDEYDDVALLAGLRASLLPDKHYLKSQMKTFIDEARPILESTGVVTYNDGPDGDGSIFVAHRGLQMLTIDAVRQLYGRIEHLENVIKAHGIII